MRDERDVVTRFFDAFIPALEVAGNYALSIRPRLGVRSDKRGDPWTSVVTDADLGVQHFFEVLMLAKFPDWQFYGEEHAASFHTRYFADNDVCVLLDPINGTRLYRDGADNFDIIVSLTLSGQLVATLSYMPGERTLFGASRLGGAFTRRDSAARTALRLRSQDMTLAVYQAQAWQATMPDPVNVFDLIHDYAADDPRCCMNRVLDGGLGGYLFGDVALLDVGATAFTVQAAGGIVTLPDGRPVDFFDDFDGTRTSDLLVCANPELHRIVSAAVSRQSRPGNTGR